MKEFKEGDIIINRIKTYPKIQIFIHDGKIYYNKEANEGQLKLQNLINNSGSK